ncbi:MAG TPA: glycosyltransferase family 2 protein [Acidimicrobiales bacterium]|nr:glycosyltransferase family 2 protein [Acidimicrobiales bacterium]
MKLVVQVPCLNEESTLPLVFERMPRSIPGISSIEFLVIDDGCTDRTAEVAASLGVAHFVRHGRTMGLGQSFHDGALLALKLGADILVNTDGDNQYPSERIPDLIRPILDGEAEIVVGDRQTHTIEHFSPLKRRLQKVGSSVVNLAAGTDIPDAASGFRAYSREALLRLNTVTRFSYCTETIIQAGCKRLAIRSIPIDTNAKTRESRLVSSMGEHVMRSGASILNAYTMYRPLRLFVALGTLTFAVGLVPFVRFAALSWFTSSGGGVGRHIPSLVVGSVLLIAALILFALGIIAELIRINRVLIEDSLEQQKRYRYRNVWPPERTNSVPADVVVLPALLGEET